MGGLHGQQVCMKLVKSQYAKTKLVEARASLTNLEKLEKAKNLRVQGSGV